MALGNRDRRALRLGAGALVLWASLQYGILPVWDRWQQRRSDLLMRETALVKYREAIAASGTEQKTADALDARLRSTEAGLLQSATPALASAELQAWTRQAAASHGIELRSSEFLQTKPIGDGYTQVPVGLEFQSHVDQLSDFLNEVRSGPRLLAVPRLQIQSSGGPDKIVSVSMTLAGVMKASAAGITDGLPTK